ncbi:MAG TPA: hypothetical protein VJB62_00710, partial [Patescibacteria group bacterium]|nr:hypothetical protein [Patescibacteria group bacterium]
MFYLFQDNRPLKKSVSSVLILSMVFIAGGWLLFAPKPAQAIVTNEATSKPTVWQTIKDAAFYAWSKAAEKYHAAASWISAKVDLWKQADTWLTRAASAALELLLHMVLNMITNEIIKWIQGGGDPRFISDWQGFLKDVADKAGGKFVDEYLGMGYLCEDFDIDIRIALLEVPTFEERVKCTITDIVDNIKDFSDNFSNGGWKAWLTLTEPQNNFYGGYLIAYEE